MKFIEQGKLERDLGNLGAIHVDIDDRVLTVSISEEDLGTEVDKKIVNYLEQNDYNSLMASGLMEFETTDQQDPEGNIIYVLEVSK